MSSRFRPGLNVPLSRRGEIPLTPVFPPLPQYLKGAPYGLDEHGKHIKDLRGNVIKPVILTMLECVENQVGPAPDRLKVAAQAREAALTQLVEQLNLRLANPVYHLTPDYLLKEGNLYSYEFSAFVHHLCNQLAGDPHYFYKIGYRILSDSLNFLFRAGSIQQVYQAIARIGSKFSAEQFETGPVDDSSIVLQRRTPATPEALGETAWLVHVASGCHTLRSALSTIPRIHSGQPVAEVEESQCLLRGDECCEWKFFWQTGQKPGWLSWWKR